MTYNSTHSPLPSPAPSSYSFTHSQLLFWRTTNDPHPSTAIHWHPFSWAFPPTKQPRTTSSPTPLLPFFKHLLPGWEALLSHLSLACVCVCFIWHLLLCIFWHSSEQSSWPPQASVDCVWKLTEVHAFPSNLPTHSAPRKKSPEILRYLCSYSRTCSTTRHVSLPQLQSSALV